MLMNNQSSMVTMPSVTVGTTSVQLLPKDESRSYICVQNRSSGTLLIKLGSDFVGTEGFAVIQNGSYEPTACPITSIYIRALSDTVQVETVVGKNVSFLGA